VKRPPTTRQGRTGEELRRHNLSAVLSELHEGGSASRSDLTRRTGLNRSTIANLVAELSERGAVVEGPPKERSGPGRPSPEVHLSETGPAVLAIDIGVDSIAVAVVGLGGQVRRMERVDLSPSRREPETVVEDIAELGRSLLSAPPEQQLVGVGVAVVGVARRRDGLVHLAPNLGWRDEPLAARIEEGLRPGVAVHVGNDADLGAIAEHKHGAGVGVENLVFLHGEVGVGAGVIIDGRPVSGADGYFGEIGHMIVNPEGRPCECGSRGCLETEIGELALLRAAGMEPTRVGREAINEVLDRAAAGDEPALRALREVGRWLGIGVASVVNIFNPELVVLGGFLARIHHRVEGQIASAVGGRALPASRAGVSIVPSRLGADATLLGAAELALAPLLSDPTIVPLGKAAA
jgi:predicted NBD/HSP70 family sugar kinase